MFFSSTFPRHFFCTKFRHSHLFEVRIQLCQHTTASAVIHRGAIDSFQPLGILNARSADHIGWFNSLHCGLLSRRCRSPLNIVVGLWFLWSSGIFPFSSLGLLWEHAALRSNVRLLWARGAFVGLSCFGRLETLRETIASAICRSFGNRHRFESVHRGIIVRFYNLHRSGGHCVLISVRNFFDRLADRCFTVESWT